MRGTFDLFSSRIGYNKALRHFKVVNGILPKLSHENLGDILHQLDEKGAIVTEQIRPLTQSLLIDKLQYHYRSFNLNRTISSSDPLIGELKNWKAFDILFFYFHDLLGDVLINPKNPIHWDKVKQFEQNELLIIFIKFLEDSSEKNPEQSALNGIAKLFKGEKFITPHYFNRSIGQKIRKQSPVIKLQDSTSKVTTPKYSVQVSNELFHNGNVEAWKNIIESFEFYYPNQHVAIYHEGVKIDNLNALFKWGKVKNGEVIFFSISSSNTIEGVSKLQRYLFEGASPRFEKFLHKVGGKALQLF